MMSYKLRAVLIFVLFTFSIVSCAQEQTRKGVHIVLLAGQSNMVGAGDFDELTTLDKERIEKVSNRVLLSTNGNEAKPLSYFNNKPSEKYNFTKRFGPEIFIGLTLAEANPNQEYLLIKRALGGTSLYGAWNPDWSAEKSNEVEIGDLKKNIKLYNLHLNDIEENVAGLKSKGKSYKFIGLTWMQGEKDTNAEVSAKSYRNNLRKLVNKYRTDLKVRELPFVIGQVNVLPRKYKPGVDLVREAQLKVGNSDLRHAIIETSTDTTWKDFPKYSDNTHYKAEGQKRLGTAFAQTLIQIDKKLNSKPFKSVTQLKPDEVIKFRALGITNATYHVYVPATFNPKDKLPIIVAFSPNGKGLGILSKLKESANRNNFILVGCDKLKNGMKDLVFEKQMEDEVLDDIFNNIPHDANRIYLAGFSGGAMRSYQLTTRRKETFAGILAYGGWLGGNDYQNKPYQENMYVAMINGDNDKGANKWEDIDAKNLRGRNCVVKYFSHPGGHKIAPTEVTNKAVSWLFKSK
ncbi:sialate O-acetylesterase [Seonamhaeicola maritimus]|uniref:sialate O-acetylesterase n=1 Tax=Seonamhaeicola maritimus TaxID=2591822 RepID=UPI002494AF25|nr:sialate O-acetylesterase [Seonamhaeicola maritimus]